MDVICVFVKYQLSYLYMLIFQIKMSYKVRLILHDFIQAFSLSLTPLLPSTLTILLDAFSVNQLILLCSYDILFMFLLLAVTLIWYVTVQIIKLAQILSLESCQKYLLMNECTYNTLNLEPIQDSGRQVDYQWFSNLKSL